METKRKIVQYRERLDRTLASPDLTNKETLKKLVKSQLLISSQPEVEEYEEKVVETKTAELSNFLDMLRSASDDCGRSNTSHTDWKLKQDSEEFRVMYREGPEGTPFHTMLVEGFVDGPVDVCLCISWQTSLYKKWWPQSTIPTFKVLSAECLHTIRVGEQISLVRVKVSWPLSLREAVVHYYLFEYFQDDLIVVLTNTVPESKSVMGTPCGFNYETIPEAKDVVRVDLVGGFALQKVTSERSYFRTIANIDIKLDFVPPSLINFISRQLIGNGFKLYQKAVASMMSHGKEEFSKALGDPLYARIREALYSINGSKVMDGGELQQVTRILPAEDLVESKQGGAKDMYKEDKNKEYANNVMPMAMNAVVRENNEAFGEIVEVDKEEIVQIEEEDEKVNEIPNKKVGEIVEVDREEIAQTEEDDDKVNELPNKIVGEIVVDREEIVQTEEEDGKVNEIPNKEVDASVLKGKKSVYIRSEVEHALETLDKAILMVRESRFHSRTASSSIANGESPFMNKDGGVDSYSTKLIQPCSKDEASVEVPGIDILEGTSQEAPETNSDIQNLRYTGTNPNLKEVNSNKGVSTSSEQNLKEVNSNKGVSTSSEQNLSRPIEASQVASDSFKNGAILDQTTCSNKQLNTNFVQEVPLNDKDKSRRQKKLKTSVTQGISLNDVPKKKYLFCCFLY